MTAEQILALIVDLHARIAAAEHRADVAEMQLRAFIESQDASSKDTRNV